MPKGSKFATDEERAAARKENCRRYRERHKEEIRRKAFEFYHAHKHDEDFKRKAKIARKKSYAKFSFDRRAYLARHRSKKMGIAGSWSGEEFVALCVRTNHLCWYCGCKPEKLVVDHATPLILGGLNVIENLRPACNHCNARKNIKTEWEFFQLLEKEG